MRSRTLRLARILPLLFLILGAGHVARSAEFVLVPVPLGLTIQDGSMSPNGTAVAFADPFFPQQPGMTLIGVLSIPQGELLGGGLETDLNPAVLSWDGSDVLLSTGRRLVLVNFDSADFTQIYDVMDGLPGGGMPAFVSVGSRGVTSGQVPFLPRGSEQGIWVASGSGPPSPLVQALDPVPPGLGLAVFAGLSASRDELAFAAGTSDVGDPDQAIYAMPVGGGEIRPLISRFQDFTLQGGGVGNFSRFFNPVLSDGNIVFEARGAPADGLYAVIGGLLHLVATLQTDVPGGSGTFQQFSDWSIEGSRVVFEGQDAASNWAVYQYTPGSLIKLLAPGDELDGLLVESVGIPRESLGGGRTLLFTSLGLIGASAQGAGAGVLPPGNYLYVAVPEPNPFLQQMGALAILLALRSVRDLARPQ